VIDEDAVRVDLPANCAVSQALTTGGSSPHTRYVVAAVYPANTWAVKERPQAKRRLKEPFSFQVASMAPSVASCGDKDGPLTEGSAFLAARLGIKEARHLYMHRHVAYDGTVVLLLLSCRWCCYGCHY
jgi:hypothetical protein